MTDRYLALDAEFVKHEIGKLIADCPELAEDDGLRLDMIEGETSAVRIVERALAERQEAEMMAGAIKAREIDLTTRRGRFERKSEAMKQLIRSIMKAAQLDKLTLPDATVSLSKPRYSVGIEDVDELPQGYVKLTKSADKDAIRKAFDNGEPVPGAAMVLGVESVIIRTK